MARDQVDEYYLTVAEVAELLRLNQQTVRNWIDQGSLPSLRVGRRVRIKRSDLDRLLTEGYRAGSPGGSGDPGVPSAEDFWGGEPVGFAEVAVGPGAEVAKTDANGLAADVAETGANGVNSGAEVAETGANGVGADGVDSDADREGTAAHYRGPATDEPASFLRDHEPASDTT